MTRDTLKILLTMVVLAVMASVASATIITNETTSTTLFEDDFEGVSAISVGFVDDPGDTDYDPSAGTGSWVTKETDVKQIQVTDFDGTTTGPPVVDYPGAYQGSNYMWVNRTGNFNSAVGSLTSVQSTAGDAIHIEWMVYFRDNPANNSFFRMYSGSGATGNSIASLSANGDQSVGGGGSLTYLSDTWQKWELDYVVNATTYDLTIDGTQATGLSVLESGGAVGSIRFSKGGGVSAKEYFVDAVPEPSTFALLSIGGLMMLIWRRRRTG